MRIRLLERGDIPRMQILGRDCHEETKGAGFRYAADKATWFCERAISHGLGLGLETEEGDLCGFFLIDRTAPWSSHDEGLWELAIYVAPQDRGGPAADLLIDAGKAIAADIGLPLILTPVSEDERRERVKSRFFERRGFKRVGSTYRWG